MDPAHISRPAKPLLYCWAQLTIRGALMRLSASLGTVFLCLSNLCHAEDPVTVIRAGTLIDGVSSQPRRNQDVVIRGNHIIEVGPSTAHAPPAGARLIDLSNSTV